MLGITEEYTYFDDDIIMHINSALMILTQLGVGPAKGFTIQSKDAVWSDFVSEEDNVEAIKTYIYLKVKLLFDPPLTSSVLDSMERLISELEWRLNVEVENV